MSIDAEVSIEKLRKNARFRKSYNRRAAIINIARLIRKLRTNANLTQSQLAERLNTTQTAISRLESFENDRLPNLVTLMNIAHECGHSLTLGPGRAVEKMPKGKKNPQAEYLVAI